MRTRPLARSETKRRVCPRLTRFPSRSWRMAMPVGVLNWAAPPTPSADPGVEEPASVVTTAVAPRATLRIWWLLVSAMYTKAPSVVAATLYGSLNAAFVPTPLANPDDTAPATVVTVRVDTTTLRSLWLLRSHVQRTTPSAVSLDTARPTGWLKRAFVPTPSRLPAAEAPATVVVTPVETTICLTRLLTVSATKARVPSHDTPMPAGKLKPLPMVETVFVAVSILRTLLLKVSATMRVWPSAVEATS